MQLAKAISSPPVTGGDRMPWHSRAFRSACTLAVALALIAGFSISSAKPASALTYVTSASWVHYPGNPGATLSITPTGVAQWMGVPAATGVWNNALDRAGRPPYSAAVYNSLYVQLQCHLYFRLKTPFNLDTWRPVVSLAVSKAYLCNNN